MWNRIAALFRAGFESQWGSGAWPVAPLVMHGSMSAVLCLLVRDELPPFAYALFALSACAGLIALPLLGDFGPLLRSDPASEWVEALPVRRVELRIARTLVLLLLVSALALAALLPAVLFAPSSLSWPARALLLACGLGQALFVAALLLALQSLLGERIEAALVLLQTLLVTGIVIGFGAGLRYVPELAKISSPSALEAAAWFPPAWFAEAGWRAALATAAALAVLACFPLPKASRARRGGGWLAVLLAPARALATRLWVRRAERGSFDLVFDALPLEREFVLRTYPMIGIPLAFLLAGARGEAGPAREGLLSVLLFTPAAYLPILLVHVPACASADARWILDSAPIAREAIDAGARKAVALRFLAPLYAVLLALAAFEAGPSFALRLGMPAALLTLIMLRTMYPKFATEPPLSVPPSEIETRMDWTGPLAGAAIGLTAVGIVAFLGIRTIAAGLAVSAALLAIELWSERKVARVAIASLALLALSPFVRAQDVIQREVPPPEIELVESAPIETTLDHPDIPNADVVWVEMIDSAKKTLDFAEFYATDHAGSRLEPVIAAIEKAAARGVKVRFLIEAKSKKMSEETAKRLAAIAGLELRWLDMASYSKGILHAKYFLVDSEEFFVGSQNFDWRSLEHIQELGVRARDSVLTQRLQSVFDLDWSRAGPERPPALESWSGDVEMAMGLRDGGSCRIGFSPKGQLPVGCYWELPNIVDTIDRAKKSVRVQVMTYQMGTRDGYWEELENALRRAASRGVQVQLLVADWCKRKTMIDGLQALEPLANVEVKLVTIPQWSGGYIPYARVIHAKYMVVDGEHAWIGTSNWERGYFYDSRNVGLLVDGGAIPKQLEKIFADGWNAPYAVAVDPCAKYEPPKFGD